MSSHQSKFRSARHVLLLTVGLGACALAIPPWASAGTEIVTDAPPPADRVEHAPARRDGYVWGAGHWEWNGRSYVWMSGTWIVERRASHWVVDRWEQVGTQWHYLPGHWERQP